MNKIAIHDSICAKLHTTYAKKNADYGDSFANVRRKFPDATLIHLNEKLSRLEELMRSGRTPCVIDESIEDTLLDMANYCILELVERRADAEAAENLRKLHGCIPDEMADLSNVPPVPPVVTLDVLGGAVHDC